jgi:hypothetical protein
MVNMTEVRTYARMGSYGVMGGASQYCREGARILQRRETQSLSPRFVLALL